MQKSIVESDILNEYRRGSHSVYKLTYHVIFVTKNRKKVITDEIGNFMKNYAAYLCGRMNSELISAETDVDHMHLLISMPPDVAPVKLINSLKSQLSKEVRNTLKNNEQKNTNANTLRQGNIKRKASAIHPTTDFIGRGFRTRCYKGG